MTQGEDIKESVDDLIDNEDIQSFITITPITQTSGTAGYYAYTQVPGTAVSTYAIPFNYIKSRLNFQKFGNLKEGEVRIIVKSSEAINNDTETTKYKVTFEGVGYWVTEIKPIFFNNTAIAKSITLVKDITV